MGGLRRMRHLDHSAAQQRRLGLQGSGVDRRSGVADCNVHRALQLRRVHLATGAVL